MGGLKALGPFLAILAGLALSLRAAHVALPRLVPETRTGPYPVASVEEVRRHTGFTPLLPAFRPEILGEAPPQLMVTRIPRPALRLRWRGERTLDLEERLGGPAPRRPPDALPLGELEGAFWWQEGATRCAVLEQDGLWITVRTDLATEDLRRIAATLRPL